MLLMQRAVSTVCYYRSLFLQNAHNLDLALSTMLRANANNNSYFAFVK